MKVDKIEIHKIALEQAKQFCPLGDKTRWIDGFERGVEYAMSKV